MGERELSVNEERAKEIRDPAEVRGGAAFNPHSQCAYDKLLRYYREPPGWFWLWSFRYRLIDLSVDELVVEESHKMFHGFCSIPYKLTIHFQATAEHLIKFYRNEFVPNINERIKTKYGKLLTVEVKAALDEFGRKALQPAGDPPPAAPTNDGPRKEHAEAVPALAAGSVSAEEHVVEGMQRSAEPAAGNGASLTAHASEGGPSAVGAKLDLFDSMSQAEAQIEERIYRYFKINEIVCHVKCELSAPDRKKIDLESVGRGTTIDSVYQKLFEHFLDKEGKFKQSAIKKLHATQRAYQEEVAAQERENKKSIAAQERLDKEAELDAAKQMAETLKNLRESEATDAEKLNEHNKRMRNLIRGREMAEVQDQTTHELSLMEEGARKAAAELELVTRDADKAELELSLRLNAARLEHELRLLEAEGEKARLLAENFIAYERQSELFKLLPALLEKMAGHTQQVEHLSIMQIDSPRGDSGEDGNGLLKGGLLNPAVQMAQSLYILRELLKLSEPPQS